ncbi:MAG: ferrous iron transport protein A [Bacilli bacterium]|nr:ferrous iron transport protein A [Bacilli bacterium]
MKLSEAPINVELSIEQIKGKASVVKHLAALGLTKGSEIALLSNQHGAVVLVVKESRLAMDKTMSSNIEVKQK